MTCVASLARLLRRATAGASAQRADRRAWRCRVPSRPQTRARRQRVEAPWLALLLRALTALDQEQEPGGTGGEAGGRGGLGPNPRGGASMANDEHVAMLKKGVAAWNAWRDQNPDLRPDLRGTNLNRQNLSGADLSGADLSKAKLSG